ncbi:MAG TPA: sigma 54-interacting transcriptional regulator [Burkholderiaceae bacterium]|nr:sigma 54-interacting transcriptional regulator [Burkholderiaceae bacterium]
MAIHRLAMQSLFERLDSLCEGAVAVDRHARIVWINEKYLATLGLASVRDALGRDIEDVIPNSLMREVVNSGQPILLDILELGGQSLVVTRMPLQDEQGQVIGAIGFVLYDQLNALKPLVVKFAKLQAELAEARRRLAEHRRPKYTFASFVGGSAPALEAKRQARRAAQQDSTVLLLGETGTGKEVLAHAIHAASARADGPFIGINMPAVPDALLEAEFFGVAPGAFTGAERKARDGKFKLADGGTLFLDEIGDLPLPLQSKLLRVLQDQEIEPLGSNRVFKVDLRVIAATSVDLDELVAQGRFRSDLYYRLSVLPIRLPPLRERLADLNELAQYLLEELSARCGAQVRDIDGAAISLLASYNWPGNVRELRNVLERATALTDNACLTTHDIAAVLPPRHRMPSGTRGVPSYADAMAGFERTLIQSALAAAGGKVPAAAKLLGLSRATVYNKMGQLGLASGTLDARPVRQTTLKTP